MVDTNQLLAILSSSDLTHKDKIVHIASALTGAADAKTISDTTGISIQSVRQSLSKHDDTLLDDIEATETVADALIAVCRMDKQSMRQKDWSALTKIASSLVDAGATADEVRVRASQYRRKFNDLALTPAALDKYWPMLSSAPTFTPSAVYR